MAGEAPDYGSMIGEILGNPDAMEGVMQVAKAMGLGAPASSASPASSESSASSVLSALSALSAASSSPAGAASGGANGTASGGSAAIGAASSAVTPVGGNTNISGGHVSPVNSDAIGSDAIGGLPAILAGAGGTSGLSALLGDRQSNEDRERLLTALRPYLNDSRSAMLDTVLRLMRLARLGDIGKLIGKL